MVAFTHFDCIEDEIIPVFLQCFNAMLENGKEENLVKLETFTQMASKEQLNRAGLRDAQEYLTQLSHLFLRMSAFELCQVTTKNYVCGFSSCTKSLDYLLKSQHPDLICKTIAGSIEIMTGSNAYFCPKC